MNQGHVEQVGTPEEVYGHPATPFVYGFLGSVNLFHGRVEDGALRVGGDAVPHAQNDLVTGSEVYAFARPHELDIIIDPAVTDGISARINRVLNFGLSARIELDGLNGASGQHFEVELSREQVSELGLSAGQKVRLLPSKLRVFERESTSTKAPGGSTAP